MSVETKQTTLDERRDGESDDEDKERLVQTSNYHRPVVTPDQHGEDVTAMPACNPHENGEFVEVDPDTLSDDLRCNSPRCFGGDR